jgi:CBS domain-containing protein
MQVQELMTRDVATCRGTDTLDRAAQLMWENDCGCIPVIDDSGKPIAMITDRDICMAGYTQGRPMPEIQVSSAMSHKILACRESDPVGTAEAIMRREQVRRLPVVAPDGRLTGILSLNDVATSGQRRVRAGSASREELGPEAVALTLSAICARSVQHAAEEVV